MTTLAAESPDPKEDQLIAEIQETLRAQMERDYAPGATKRDAHPKHGGLLEGLFTVAADLPAELRVGLFGEARSYKAWIRTSNANGKPQSDAAPDVRGFAIKLLDVPGEPIAENDEPGAQDFILLSMDTMPLGTVRLFRDAIVYGIKWSRLIFVLKMIFTGRATMLRALNAGRILPSSPLDIRYWSTTPYRFGSDRAAKYSIIPHDNPRAPSPPALGETYLADAMARQLAERSYGFDFAVQLRTPTMPIEDAAVRWEESASPFVKVATLTIPRQTFLTPERAQLAEALSFSPAHARGEHRPLGGVNRARMRIYRALSEFRHARNRTASR